MSTLLTPERILNGYNVVMETLLQDRRVYGYLMERYAKSGEVWRRLRDDGYGV